MAQHDVGAEDGGKLKVFVSYSRRDLVFADSLVVALEGAGYAVFIDRRDLPYGEVWQGELTESIRGADTAIWLISPDSVVSRWCAWELGEVLRYNKRLLPLRVREVAHEQLPDAISKIHLMPAEGVFDVLVHFDALCRALETDRNWIREGTRLADRARQWLGRQRDNALLLRGAALADAEHWRQRQPRFAPTPNAEILELVLASRQAATRRGRYWLAGTTVLLLMSIAGGVWSYSQKIEADRQRELADDQRSAAERNYNFSIDAVESLAIGLASDLRDATGMRIERIRSILGRAETIYTKLGSATGVTVRQQRSQVWLLKEVSQTYYRLGDTTTSRDRIDKAVAAARKLSVMGMAQRDADAVLTEVLVDQAETAFLQADKIVVRSAFEEAIGLAQRHAADTIGKKRLIYVLGRAGTSLARSDVAAAREAVQQQVQVATEIVTSAPGDVDAISTLAGALYNLGLSFWGDNDLPSARTTFEATAQAWRQLGQLAPKQREHRHGLLRALQRLSDVTSLAGDDDAAFRAEREALGIARELAAEKSDSHQSQIDISFALARVINQKVKSGQTEGIWDEVDEVLALTRRVSQMDLSDAQAAETLGNTLQWVGQDIAKLGNRRRALEAVQESLEIARKLARAAPDDVRSQSTLAFRLAVASELLARPLGIAALEESVAILRALLGTGRMEDKFRATVAHYEAMLAKLKAATDMDAQSSDAASTMSLPR